MQSKKWGLGFPLAIENRTLANLGIYDSIKSNISTLIATQITTRNFNENFGTVILGSLGKPSTLSQMEYVRFYTLQAIKTYEPRLSNVQVQVSALNGLISITVTGTITQTDEIFEFNGVL